MEFNITPSYFHVPLSLRGIRLTPLLGQGEAGRGYPTLDVDIRRRHPTSTSNVGGILARIPDRDNRKDTFTSVICPP